MDATGPWGTLGYTYDGVGNRQMETTDTGITNYTYTANRLMSSTGEKTLTFGYDNNGNSTFQNNRQYTYNQNQRLIRAAEGNAPMGEYVYNALGQRAIKTAAGISTIYHFNNLGQLIEESAMNGTLSAEYVYLNGQPLAQSDANGINYIHIDHLGTPVMMTNASGAKVWEIESQPFSDLSNITGQVVLNISFPGQYYDAETGLHYNYFRDYNPKIGRYVEADPIGIRSDINLYVYVGNDSVNWIDPTGLDGEAAANWAMNMKRKGNGNYGFLDPHQESKGRLTGLMGGRKSNKCNAFVWDALKAGGNPVGRMSDGRIPSAADWADPNSNIAGYVPVPSGADIKKGDVVAFGGHVGLYYSLGNGRPGTISAKASLFGEIVHNTWGFRPNQKPTVWRCLCDIQEN